ncbi:DUF6541 family protein [Microbacterium sp. UBA837]|uniref:DUF6541 family protein n=1 Tax=Microbacterium sp. UBA837 TaxID=1946956 RepID=UPI0025E743EF|nr:DUF6541 family protein [Microbacterium sp. UBA837]|tara:strand:- start:24 stop:1946 length:1923 start_codon:yes stop_codon:yes gene_type:complete
MIESWSTAIAPFTVAVLALIMPGAVIVAAGWGIRNARTLLLVPAISVAVIGAAAVLAPLVGVGWSFLPVLAFTVLIGAIAYGLRRLARGFVSPTDAPKLLWWAGGAVASAFVVISAQLVWAFADPANIAQRFDAIVHLNSVRYAVETANASAFNIGATSDITFYPNAWHAIASLVSVATDATVPIAVNVTNIAVSALLWPASVTGLALALAGNRAAVALSAAVLSTGFGAFPALFFNWGVLYPNATGYAVAPAVIAVAIRLGRDPRALILRDVALLLLLAGGAFLAHPNALLVAYALSTPLVLIQLLQHALQTRTLRTSALTGAGAAALLAFGLVLWVAGRTSAEHSGWDRWQSAAQALGEGLLVAPRGFAPAFVAAVLVGAAVVAIVRRPSLFVVAVPFAVTVFLFVIASGTPREFFLREALTNPWYNDANRLAAMLPLGMIPLAALGGAHLSDYVRLLMRSWSWNRSAQGVTIVAMVIVFVVSVTAAGNVRGALAQVKEAYSSTPDSLLLSPDERALLERLGTEVPEDALIAGSPRTGTSLALAISGRDVTEMHVFGTRSDDELFLDAHLRDIDQDPRVCQSIRSLGVDYVLDFGDRDILDSAEGTKAYAGIQNLNPGEHLELVDSQGDARLFQVVGC